MALTKTQVKAVILILLVVGQDCMRIQRTTSNAHLQRRLFATTEPAEEQLREANQQCSWKLLKGGCTGPACSFRPLPLDASLSESCRLTNDYMLNSSDRDNYVPGAQEWWMVFCWCTTGDDHPPLCENPQCH